MGLLNILKFTFAINHVNEADLKELGIPNELCQNALTFLQSREI
ncbi:hypothetical protein [Halalkalibacterium ligniniphilum]|nr:hypothetical protein [Halalkalibacterium ligniniphilum]